ncbi:MAG: DNA-directed RNA polymerase omega subunit [uncultured Rubrobacteraceae bacterium]|uniref:DNA-directed RNA polymerase subunit omega n=1 Tax=uncultured Rubrobacteraceae bacterium TaxID=349277 RepID=A0A6J4QNI9_9ACTN|nr:MAG: DNA-directed RNA polymerase omega subunit [uncultured Rubrobacteraceae bacterium]
MLNELKIDELLGKVDSRYGLVLVAARRAREINEYAATLGLNDSLGIPGPQVHTRSQHPLSISFEELRANKLDVGFKRPPEEADEEELTDAAAAGDTFLDPPSGAGTAPGAASTDASGEDEGAA